MLIGTHDEDTIDELAEQLVVQRSHLAKVVQRLQHLEMLETVRGRGGGVLLAPAALRAGLGALVRRLEDDDEVVSCEQLACPLRAGCRLRGALRQAQEAFYATLDEMTIGDLLTSPTQELLLSLGSRPPQR